jgi:hypothetical protein
MAPHIDDTTVRHMAHRIELTMAWLDLDGVIANALLLDPKPANGVWRCKPLPAPAGARRLTGTAWAALTLTVGGRREYVLDDLRKAKHMIRNALATYQRAVLA